VVDVSDSTLLIWLRHSGAGDTEDATQDFEAFEQMLETVTFRDEAPPTTETTTGAVSSTAIDGTWTTSFTREELADSPLLFDSDEVNDDNWGDFTLTFRNGAFTLEGTNPKASSSISGSFVVDDDVVRLSLEGGDEFVMRYSVEGDVLAFERDESLGVAPTPLVLQPWNREA
jgi:hypothetical protein